MNAQFVCTLLLEYLKISTLYLKFPKRKTGARKKQKILVPFKKWKKRLTSP